MGAAADDGGIGIGSRPWAHCDGDDAVTCLRMVAHHSRLSYVANMFRSLRLTESL
jgi:hypothetical protein